MKIDRVIFCLNENPLYADFWNIVSKVWAKMYKVTPTLAFVGSKSSIKKLNLSEEYGEIYQIDPTKTNDNWEVTWSIFYLPTLFPDDICMTSGIDQLPLGNTLFLDAVSKVEEDELFVGFGNAYIHNQHYPSSHLVGKGRVFKEVFSIDDSFDTEIEKIRSYFSNNPTWGADEVYAGPFLKRSSKVVFADFFPTWAKKRLCRSKNLQYDLEGLKNKRYSESHLPRPYCKHKAYIDKLVEDLLK